MVGRVLASETIYALEASNVTVSGGGQLSGISQGSGVHLNGRTITLTSNDWVAVNIIDTEANFDDSDNSQTLDGDQSFNGEMYDSGIRVEAEYRVTVEDPMGVEYTLIGFNFNEPGVTSFATVEGLAFVDTGLGFPPINTVLTVTGTFEGPSVPYANLAEPPCFTPGSRICTPEGLRDVADLEAGDRVFTMDHGLRVVRWVGHTRLPSVALAQNPKFRPILIRKDALGKGRPCRDMHVSPQHRILMTGWQAELLFGELEVLVPAIKLCNGTTIVQEDTVSDVTYVHIMLDEHEVVCVDGIATESYLPAAQDRTPMAQELRQLFPELVQLNSPMTMARPCVSDRGAKVIAA